MFYRLTELSLTHGGCAADQTLESTLVKTLLRAALAFSTTFALIPAALAQPAPSNPSWTGKYNADGSKMLVRPTGTAPKQQGWSTVGKTTTPPKPAQPAPNASSWPQRR